MHSMMMLDHLKHKNSEECHNNPVSNNDSTPYFKMILHSGNSHMISSAIQTIYKINLAIVNAFDADNLINLVRSGSSL